MKKIIQRYSKQEIGIIIAFIMTILLMCASVLISS